MPLAIGVGHCDTQLVERTVCLQRADPRGKLTLKLVRRGVEGDPDLPAEMQVADRSAPPLTPEQRLATDRAMCRLARRETKPQP